MIVTHLLRKVRPRDQAKKPIPKESQVRATIPDPLDIFIATQSLDNASKV
eukprot:COSAG05_NODE_19168_length_296_cov_1.593909_1_plen_49_part_10